jgi:hypothetical protein
MALAVGVGVTVLPVEAIAAAPVPLGTAGDFGVLAGEAVLNTGLSVIDGELGVSPGPPATVTGFPPGTITGGRTPHVNDAAAMQAHADLVDAYAAMAAQPVTEPAITGNLGGRTLGPGVHASAATIAVTGTLTLDAGGDPSAVFILRAGSTLDGAASSEVILEGGAQACNVYWQVGISATLAANSQFSGTIVAAESLTLGAGMTIAGRALARDGDVTMDSTSITVPPCVGGPRSNTAPAIQPFDMMLTGLTQTVHTGVGAWSVTDPTGSDDGYSVTVSTGAPTVDGSNAKAGTGGSLSFTPTAPTAAEGNAATDAFVVRPTQPLSGNAATIVSAPAGTGQGRWNFTADAGDAESLAVTVPGDTSTGSYSSTLTFTTAPPA